MSHPCCARAVTRATQVTFISILWIPSYLLAFFFIPLLCHELSSPSITLAQASSQASRTSDDDYGDTGDNSQSREKYPQDDGENGRHNHSFSNKGVVNVGGIRWKDLSVCLEYCPATTSATSNHGNGANNDYSFEEYTYYDECQDDSVWLLHPSSGFIEDGSLCGIIGPSGSGKTTFLSALGGTTPKNSGVFLSGSVWYDEIVPSESLRGNIDSGSNSCNSTASQDGKDHLLRYFLSQKEGDIAMLSQQDNFFDMLTPRESLTLASYLEQAKRSNHNNGKANANGFLSYRKKNDASQEELVVEKTLSSLGLSNVADRRIGDRMRMGSFGGIGGGVGRRRRRKGGGKGIFGSTKSFLQNRLSDGHRRRGGGLSGGERRRLSVAMELITEPKVFLADEPTTGLDSAQAEKVVKLISNLAKERHVPSICTLHQPKSSIWKTLDSFILLAPGGKMCFVGDRQAANAYFKELGYECPSDTNPAEYYIDLVTIDTDDPTRAAADAARINFLHQNFMESCKAVVSHDGSLNKWLPPHPDNASKQDRIRVRNQSSSFSSNMLTRVRGAERITKRFGALLRRSLRQNIRNVRVNLLRLGASVVQAKLFATIYNSVRDDKSVTKSLADRVALLTYGVINMSMMALMKALDLFSKERSVVTREQTRNNYSSLEYLLAKVVAEIPLDTSFAVIFSWVLKKSTGLRTSLGTLIKTYSLMTVTTVSLGFAIGSCTSTVEAAMSTGIPFMVVLMILGVINPSGVDPDDPSHPVVEWLKLASPFKYAIEALVVAEFRDMAFGEKDRSRWGSLKDLPRMGALAMVKDGNEVLQSLGLATTKYSQTMKGLAILSGTYLLMSWVGLTFFGPKFIDLTGFQG